MILNFTTLADNKRLCVSIPVHKMILDDLTPKDYHVFSLLKQGESMTDFTYSQHTIKLFSSCKLFFRVLNHYFDDEFVQKLRDFNPELLIIDISKEVPLEKKLIYDKEFQRYSSDINKIQNNEYYWLNPIFLKTQVPKIVDVLSRYFPNNNTLFLKNQENVIQKLEDLNSQIFSNLELNRVKKIIVFDDVMAYFLNHYSVPYFYLPYNKDDITAKKIELIIDFAREKNISLFLSSIYHKSRLIRALKKPLNGEFVFFDPMTSKYESTLLSLSKKLSK